MKSGPFHPESALLPNLTPHSPLFYHYSSVTVKITLTPPHPNVPKSLNPFQNQLKSKTLLSSHQTESPKYHHLNQVWVRLWVQFILEQNSPPSSDLQNQRTSYMLQQTTMGHTRTPAVDTEVRGEKMEGTKEVTGPNQLGNPVRQIPLGMKPGINRAWLLDLPWFQPYDILPFS